MVGLCAELSPSPQQFLNNIEFLGDEINLENDTKADVH